MSAATAAHKLELRLADVTFRASLSGRESNHLSIYTPIVVGWVGSKFEEGGGVECLTLFNEYDEIRRDKDSEYLLRVSL